MYIHEFNYNEDNRRLYVEFSTKQDGDEFYRVLELPYDQVLYYSPEIIIENDLADIDVNFLIEILDEYFNENDMPEQLSL